jgi:hypothetical protein
MSTLVEYVDSLFESLANITIKTNAFAIMNKFRAIAKSRVDIPIEIFAWGLLQYRQLKLTGLHPEHLEIFENAEKLHRQFMSYTLFRPIYLFTNE